MLRIDLAELFREPGKHIEVDLDETPKSDEDVTYLAPVRGHVSITNAGELVLLRGGFATIVQLECGRCLGEVREPIDAEIEEQYSLSDVDYAAFHNTEVSIVADEDNEVPEGLMHGAVMDLSVIIRQAVILAMPLSPLCKEECLGLCPVCGKNRNEASRGCRCEQSVRHTPLAVLKELYGDEAPTPDNDQGAGPANSNNGSGASC